MKMVDGIPRRSRIDLNQPVEHAIRRAMAAVEAAGAHPLLTEAVILLGSALNKAADWVERGRCNIHEDCDLAEDKAARAGKPELYGPGSVRLQHCSDEDCEDCFGK